MAEPRTEALPPESGATQTESSASQAPQPPDGPSRYAVLRLHARGGLGEVFVAQDRELNREVALKRIQERHADHPDSRRRFLAEAEITAGLEHPGVVPVYGLVQDDQGRPCYAMRFVQGETLSDALRRFHVADPASRDSGERSLAFRHLLHHFLGMCQAVAYAHSRGVIHRDLKPQNVMLGKYGETLVVDWGLAKPVGRSDDVRKSSGEATLEPTGSGEGTAMGSVVGTPGYMSPEQAAGRWDVIGPASDLYSLGATLYTLLTGRPPLQGDNWPQIQQQIQRGDFPRPREVNKDVPPALEAICLKAMALKPEDRYPLVLALADDVERWLADEPVSAHRELLRAHARRWARRHRVAVTAAAAAAVVLAVCLAVGAGLLARAYREVATERNEARVQRDKARERLRQAGGAVHHFSTLINDNPQMKSRGMERLRTQLLEDALGFFEKFLEGEEGTEEGADLEHDRARLFVHTALLYGATGRHAQAEKAYLRGITLMQEVIDADPRDQNTRQNQAMAYLQLAALYGDTGRQREADRAFEQGLAIRRQLADDAPADPMQQGNLAHAYNSLAIWYSRTGRKEQAIELYSRALAIRRRLADAHSDRHDFVEGLAHVLNNLGLEHYYAHRFNEAEKHFGECLTLVRKLVKARPEDSSDQLYLAQTYHNLAMVYGDTGRHDLAEQSYRQSRDLLVPLAQTHPDVVQYRELLGQSQLSLGILYATRNKPGDLDLAERADRDTIHVFTRLVNEYPEVLDYRAYLGGTQGNLANVLGNKGDPMGALESNTQSIRTLLFVVEKNPRHRNARSSLRNSYANRADTLHKQGNLPEALADLDRALKFDDGDRGDVFRFRRLQCIAEMGEHARAVAEAGPLAAKAGAGRDTLLQAADVFALAVPAARKDARLDAQQQGALAERYAARAVELLTQAQMKGVVFPDHLAQSDRLAPLREREDFRRLLVGLRHRLFMAHYEARRPAEAEAELLKLRHILKGLADQRPDDPGLAIEVARTHFNMAQVNEHFRAAPARAEAEHHKALAILEPLARRYPADKDCAGLMAECYGYIGALRTEQGKGERDALIWFDRAVAALDTVLQKEPGHAVARQIQCINLLKRAKALGRTGELARGVQDMDRALRLADTPAQRFALSAARGVLLGRQGKHAEAAASVAGGGDKLANSSGELYDLACVYALCSAAALRDAKLAEAQRRQLSGQYAMRAVTALRQAAAKGYRNVEHMKVDSDLDVLRGRDDYRKLLSEMTPPG
jgi:tetratricopeptide (TPR) repeat protein/tRNA A-37 threonylcarbamoyl transferase component Bud32